MSGEVSRIGPRRVRDGELAALLDAGGGEARGIPAYGVRALMLAMLEDAVRAYLGSEQRGRVEAAEWLHSGRSRWVFSFTTVCETLGLEPAAVRAALQRLATQGDGPRRLALGKSRPNARQANLRITLPRVRRRRPVPPAA